VLGYENSSHVDVALYARLRLGIFMRDFVIEDHACLNLKVKRLIIRSDDPVWCSTEYK
jgi:hypothetical protein